MSESIQTLTSLALGSLFVGSVLFLDTMKSEHFGNDDENMQKINQMRAKYPQNQLFYANAQANARRAQALNNGYQNVQSNMAYAGPMANIPQSKSNAGLYASGDQLFEYQLYQQAVNAATPTLEQLNSISGESQEQTGNTKLKGGVSSDYAPYDILSSPTEQNEYQAVNIPNKRSEQISACAQNAPTFVATSLLPKPNIPGEAAWNIGAPQDILANQNFLSATQQVGVDTVLSSLRNPSYDIRGTIPNPINVVSPWMNTTITPDLERRPLEDFIPSSGLYGSSNLGVGGTYIGRSD